MLPELSILTDSIKAGNRSDAKALTQRALELGAAPQSILNAMITGMQDVGRRFRDNEVFVPEVLIAARAMKEGMALLEPSLIAAGYQPIGTIVLGTVKGDLHDIGKNLVSMMLRGAGFAVHDLGTNVPIERFIDSTRQHDARLIGLSALLTTTIPSMSETVEAIKAALPEVKVMVGGAPVTAAVARAMGADGYAADAVSAVNVAKELLGLPLPVSEV